MAYRIAVLPGDGVGPEIVAQGVKALQAATQRFKLDLQVEHGLIGKDALKQTGTSLPQETVSLCRRSHAVLFGAGGSPVGQDAYRQMEHRGALARSIRAALGLGINIRPVWVLPPLDDCAWLGADRVRGTSYVVVRELSSGIHYPYKRGIRKDNRGKRVATNTIRYTEDEVVSHLQICFRLARERRRKLTLVLQDNVVETSQLWRQIGLEMAPQFPDVEVQHLVPDNFAHLLLRDPKVFDVVVVDHPHMAGMLNDQAAAIMGSLGMPPSGAFRVKDMQSKLRGIFGMYEPIHGSVPHRAGKDEVNPIGTILSVAMAFQYSLDRPDIAEAINASICRVLKHYRTYDIWREGTEKISTSKMGDLIAADLSAQG